MPKFFNKQQISRLSDSEIEAFFKEALFEGIYSTKIRSKQHIDRYKGSISEIKLNGIPSNITGAYINVPKTCRDIPEGPCVFKCRPNFDAIRDQSNWSWATIISDSLQPEKSKSNFLRQTADPRIHEKDLCERWGVDDCEFIGFYRFDDIINSYVVEDLRKPNFDHIPYYPQDNQKRPIRIKFPHPTSGIELGNYYLFTWKLSHKNPSNPYEICIDRSKQPQAIQPKWFIDKLFEDRHNDKSKNFGSARNFLDTLSKQLSANESTFVYELLQNANDYPVEGKMVDVEFHITDNYLLFLHSGDKFNVRNISGICGINEKEKIANKRTIGYKGIGFKTVFLHNRYVYIKTGDYSFRFDEGETSEKNFNGKIKRIGAPYQILPIWTEPKEVPSEVSKIFNTDEDKFNVRIALRPESNSLLHDGKNSYETLFCDIFADANIILFIPNINSVKVVINGIEERVCTRNSTEWEVGHYEADIDKPLQEVINQTIEKGTSRIPEKYKDFDATKVSFACKHEGKVIIPESKATIYCYLPTRASWGFPFLMNTDMIPKGDRNDIETEVELQDYTNFNEELASIAGTKFFDWIYDLLKSYKYQLGSIYSLIPDFKKCKREHYLYEDFIDKFEESFNSRVLGEYIIPVKRGLANVKHVVLDTTGLTSSGIMTDAEFLMFSEHEEYFLPLTELREDPNFNVFLKTYADDAQKFAVKDLSSLINNDKFKEWLSIEENNHKFLNFLLEKDYLKNLVSEEIFLDVSGVLCSADRLYYDIDKHLSDLTSFSNYLWYLSPNTRKYFDGNKKWVRIIDNFKDFDCDEFVDTLMDDYKAEVIDILHDKEASLHFYKFLAENVQFKDVFKDLPFISSEGDVVSNFNNKLLFFSSAEGETLFDADWLSDIEVAFTSKDYSPKTQEYFEKGFGIVPFSEQYVIENVILNSDYIDLISRQMGDDYVVSKGFVDFCYKHKDLFGNNALSGYALSVTDKNEESSFVLTEDIIFFPSHSYRELASKKWLNCHWTHALNQNYFEDIPDSEDFKKFLSKSFGVLNFTDKVFYQKVVKKHLPDIFKLTNGSQLHDNAINFDFIAYLDQNYQLIFEDENDAAKFSSIFICSNEGDYAQIGKTVYIYDAELETIQTSDWFPKEIITLCNKVYGQSRALAAIGCNNYTFQKFYDAIIVNNINKINNQVSSKEISIAFHNFIIDHMDGLTSKQIEEMRNANLFLYGKNIPSATSNGHRILNELAKELFDRNLVRKDDIDIIDPDYHADDNIEYWENRLGNSQYGIEDFFEWLQSNSTSFNERIESFEQNKNFYRWLKANADENQLRKIKSLDLTKFFVKKEGAAKSSAVYFPDNYLLSGGIEDLVKLFDPNASFISPSYLNEDDDISSWYTFWSLLGVKSDIIDILYGTVIPNLESIKNDKLPSLLADHRTQLEVLYPDGLIKALKKLMVKGANGDFYSLSNTIYIDCDLEEPLDFIELPNVINFDSKEEKRLIKDILDEVSGKRINTLSEWLQEKVNYYLRLQDENDNEIRALHYPFIRELSKILYESKDMLKQISGMDKILLLDRDNQFHLGKELTMGSKYNPRFDFEQCSVNKVYITDTYIDSDDSTFNVYNLLNIIGVHSDFGYKDIQLLAVRACAVHFWTQYINKENAPLSKIKDWISKDELNNIACIPTKDYMKKPTQLYYGPAVKRYLKDIDDWENKVPLQEIPEIKLSDERYLLSYFPFGKKLKFEDALYALRSKDSQDTRKELLNWLIDDYERDRHERIITEYRELDDSKWFNTKNEPVHIKEVFALDNKDEKLSQYFGSNPKIINNKYFPGGENFRKACDILGIVTIKSSDLVVEVVDEKKVTNEEGNLKLYALVIAGVENPSKWEELYASFCERIQNLSLFSCSKINITCQQDNRISISLKKFYRENNKFYYVKNELRWKDSRIYIDFCETFADYIGAKDVVKDVLLNLMHSSEEALNYFKESNELKLDHKFKAELEKLLPGATEGIDGNPDGVDKEPFEESGLSNKGGGVPRDEKPTDTQPTKPDSTPVNLPSNVNPEDIKLSEEEDYEFDDNYEATIPEGIDSLSNEFLKITVQSYLDGDRGKVVCEHYRGGTWVRGHYRNDYWVSGHWRGGCYVGEHTRKPGSDDVDQPQSPTKETFETSNDGSKGSAEHTHRNDNNGSKGTAEHTPRNDNNGSKGTAEHTPHNGNNGSKGTAEHTPHNGNNGTAGSAEHTPHNGNAGTPDKTKGYGTPPKPYGPDDIERRRPKPSPLTLESMEPTVDERNILEECGISPEQIADTNYLAKLRLYQNLRDEQGEEPEESFEEFIRNARNVACHKMKSGKYIHACSAARGVMYIGPSVWKKMLDDKWVICVYLDGKGSKFHYINNSKDFLDLVEKDDIIIKITGPEKVDVVNHLYSSILNGVKGTAYTLIRVASQTNIDTLFARYVGAMAEKEDGNDELDLENFV